MTYVTNVSFLGQSLTQSNRIGSMNKSMSDLQRQITTQKKYETMAGFGIEAQRVLRMHAEQKQIQSYQKNIDRALSRAELMNDTLDRIANSVKEMADAVRAQPGGDATFDVADISSRASELLNYVIDLTNIKIDDHYLFSGTDSQNPPFESRSTLDSVMQTQMIDWLDGTNTTTTMLNNINTLDSVSPVGLGFSSTVQSARDVSVQIDTSMEVRYGARADQSGIQNVIRVLAFLSNIEQPDPATDIPTSVDFAAVLDDILSTAVTAANEIKDSQVSVISKINLMVLVNDAHTQDSNTLLTLIEKEENVDTVEAVTMLQSLQTQITASYKVTSLLSELSLVNFL